jgi:hypothetical protein
MPRIFDNIEHDLLPTLLETLQLGERADCCVGYFNLRGWHPLAPAIDRWRGGSGHCCRLLIGMQSTPSEDLRQALRLRPPPSGMDNQTAVREKRRLAEEFREQLTCGVPTASDETTLRQLARQLHAKQLIIKVHLRYPLHAKLYLVHRHDANNPITGFVGSSNLTLAGLSQQGELNLDVLEHDACHKLAAWFEARWQDRWCFDISQDLAAIIDESWAAERLIPPYHIYLRLAWSLSEDARIGLLESQIPPIFNRVLFDFQAAAVKIAARRLNQRGGVFIGDVVGLGKSLMATALAKVFEEDHGTETLIICPKNLVTMWEEYAHRYQLRGHRVLSLSRVLTTLPDKTPRYRVVLIDEAHNLRNKEGKRWRVIRDYIHRNDSKVILLSATPYNKNYRDLSAQLALFIKEEADLGIRPDQFLRTCGGEKEFMARYQCSVRSLAAFEKSDEPDDWRELIRLYMVRRTRSFIMQHYAHSDKRGRYLLFPDGSSSYFPRRIPKTVLFTINAANPHDPYARLYAPKVVATIEALHLPRYGLGQYLELNSAAIPTSAQEQVIKDLSRAGKRLMGFCRTNLFKRLESAGPAFLLSIERHILRNFCVLYAIEHGLEIPIGTQDAILLDARDDDTETVTPEAETADDIEISTADIAAPYVHNEMALRQRAQAIYHTYQNNYRQRFRWLPNHLFTATLAEHLLLDAQHLLQILEHCHTWNPAHDTKLAALLNLVTTQHPQDKLLIFTQFADTAVYLATELAAHGVKQVAYASGHSADPTALAQRFSPESNAKRDRIKPEQELRVLVATDVLSEGQNLQDCAVIVNYDLPWAIIRLIQRAGRVDRIGQRAEQILCYSFVPAEGIEQILGLRRRVQQRLQQNAEVIGSDELFFDDEDQQPEQQWHDLYTERSGILDEEELEEGAIDLSSYAYQIWKNATDADPSLIATIEKMPNGAYTAKAQHLSMNHPAGVLVYSRTAQGNDALAWLDHNGQAVTHSQLTILKAAACQANTPALPFSIQHHGLTKIALERIIQEEQHSGGALGRSGSARAKTFERIKKYRIELSGRRDLFNTEELQQLDRIIEEIYRYPLLPSALDILNRQLRLQITDRGLVELLFHLKNNERLCQKSVAPAQEMQLICSLGLQAGTLTD